MRRVVVAGVVPLVILAVGIRTLAADHVGPVVEPLARSSFGEDVAVQVRVQHDTWTIDRSLDDASDVVLVRITLAPGARAPWHMHSGPGFLLNAGPGTLTSILTADCQSRDYAMGAALVDPGGETLHAAVNNGAEEVVVYAIFFGVENGPVTPTDPPADCEF